MSISSTHLYLLFVGAADECATAVAELDGALSQATANARPKKRKVADFVDTAAVAV